MNKIREILQGIDQQDTVEGGWWETSTGAEFGAKKLAEVEEYVGALRAQVNCLYKELDEVLDVIRDKLPTDDWSDFRFETIVQAIRTTPEQCLVEVKAKVIEEYKQEQAEMKQIEFATKVMVSSI